MQLLSRGMIFAEKLAVLNNSEKLVIDALIQIMNEFKTEENAQEMVVVRASILESNVIGDTVDLIVLASKRELDLNKVFEKTKGCIGCLEREYLEVKDNNYNFVIEPTSMAFLDFLVRNQLNTFLIVQNYYYQLNIDNLFYQLKDF